MITITVVRETTGERIQFYVVNGNGWQRVTPKGKKLPFEDKVRKGYGLNVVDLKTGTAVHVTYDGRNLVTSPIDFDKVEI
jgi:hypothetical protein